MKNFFSLFACGIICIVMLQYRVYYSDLKTGNPPLKITEWDALGYYLYLPSTIIYHDYKKLEWLPAIDNKYGMSGGTGYPATKLDNGNYAFKYLGGVAIMELPFFFIGHWIAIHYGYPPDGFSPPYQYAITFGDIFYCILTIFLLRKILRRYFSDGTTAITLLGVCLATNFIEYAAIENGQSHGFIFPLYILVLYTTIKWHERPSALWVSLTGLIIGLATICRPTEAIMLFIPLFWNMQTKESAKEKWLLVKQHKQHIVIAALFGVIGVLPQLIYWKSATGSFIYDVGSAWDFLNPHFRVLFGWEKGWFIYTPITVFFIAGMFFIKKFPFRKAVLWFCLLNIYIIIGWRDWRYGGSYSTRALMQSYPIFALAFGAFVERINLSKWQWGFYVLFIYLGCVNLFQICQYRTGTLHYDDMNRRYYSRIYLNANPAPVDMSLLDSNELLNNEKGFNKKVITETDSAFPMQFHAFSQGELFQDDLSLPEVRTAWLRIECSIKAPGCLWQSFLHADLQMGDSVKHTKDRLFSPISHSDQTNKYIWYMSVPTYFKHSGMKVYISSPFTFSGIVEKLVITEFDQAF